MQTCGAGIMSADDLYSTSSSCGCFGNEDRYNRKQSGQVGIRIPIILPVKMVNEADMVMNTNRQLPPIQAGITNI